MGEPMDQAPENVRAGSVVSPESCGPDPKDPRPCSAIAPGKGMWPTVRQASPILCLAPTGGTSHLAKPPASNARRMGTGP